MRKFLVVFAVTDRHSSASTYSDCTVYDSFLSTEILSRHILLEDGEKANEQTFRNKVEIMRDEAKKIFDEYVETVKFIRHNDGIYDKKLDAVREFEKFLNCRIIAWSFIEE